MARPGVYPPPDPTTPRKAPWDHVEELCNKLDILIAALGITVPVEPGFPPVVPGVPPVLPDFPEFPSYGPIVEKLEEIKNLLTILDIKGVISWQAGPILPLYYEKINTTGTFSSEMMNWKEGKRLMIKVTSTLDQDATIQVLGNIENSVIGSVNINAGLNCAANSAITVGMAWDDWHPYIGCQATLATAPTKGMIKVQALVQR